MAPTVTQVADDTFHVAGAATNWILLTEGDALTLIDAGYPGDYDDVLTSISTIGFTPEQIAAVLVTHAHVDHVGSLPKLLESWGPPVYTSGQEVQHARRDYLEQASRADVMLRCWRPKVARWAIHVVKAGGTDDIAVPQAEPFPRAGLGSIPGSPVPIMTPGHTSGHTCYYLPSAKAMVTGDALVTGHAISSIKGPQVLDGMFHNDARENLLSLQLLSGYDADVVLPGHGPVWNRHIGEAVAAAR
ncbi:MAG: MBL fold metallo-hydrolase [Aeromicrobium sp.]